LSPFIHKSVTPGDASLIIAKLLCGCVSQIRNTEIAEGAERAEKAGQWRFAQGQHCTLAATI
jgi:hypothetical protein